MLQRMGKLYIIPVIFADEIAEDMEYDACLTVAASDKDSLRRIAFVGAFAMSNYSSTIGRIAKPFNPLLSQSFEYAIPNRYRYISEQVSHHPVSLLRNHDCGMADYIARFCLLL